MWLIDHISSWNLQNIITTWQSSLKTIYFKSRSSQELAVLLAKSKKTRKLLLSFCGIAKYVTGKVNWYDFFIKHAKHYNDMTQKPHDHLFEKSWQPGIGSRTSSILQKSHKLLLSYCGEAQYVTGLVNWSYIFIKHALHYNDMTQKPHDHLFQKLGKPGICRFTSKILKITKIVTFLLWCRQIRYWWG